MSASCRSCGASIVWATTHKGRPMPVDADPVEGGNVRLRRDGEKVIAEYPGKEHPALFEDDAPRYVSHFSTCPEAEEWRRQA